MRGKANSLRSPRLVSFAAAHLLTSCLCRTLLAGECHAPLPPTTANRPFLTSDEAVAMFMCTLQNNWPRLGAQLALPGQLHLTALHTYFTLFSVQFQCLCALFSSVFSAAPVLVNCPKALVAYTRICCRTRHKWVFLPAAKEDCHQPKTPLTRGDLRPIQCQFCRSQTGSAI